jgi:hypothetical protein
MSGGGGFRGTSAVCGPHRLIVTPPAADRWCSILILRPFGVYRAQHLQRPVAITCEALRLSEWPRPGAAERLMSLLPAGRSSCLASAASLGLCRRGYLGTCSARATQTVGAEQAIGATRRALGGVSWPGRDGTVTRRKLCRRTS